eukprot:Gb_19442 [translate_table: standard]
MSTVFGFMHEEDDGMHKIFVDFGMVEHLAMEFIGTFLQLTTLYGIITTIILADLVASPHCPGLPCGFLLRPGCPTTLYCPPVDLCVPHDPRADICHLPGGRRGLVRPRDLSGCVAAHSTPALGLCRPPCGCSRASALFHDLCRPPAACPTPLWPP